MDKEIIVNHNGTCYLDSKQIIFNHKPPGAEANWGSYSKLSSTDPSNSYQDSANQRRANFLYISEEKKGTKEEERIGIVSRS